VTGYEISAKWRENATIRRRIVTSEKLNQSSPLARAETEERCADELEAFLKGLAAFSKQLRESPYCHEDYAVQLDALLGTKEVAR
jgi:hypothetical protein